MPKPQASSAQVRHFLVNFFLVLDDTLTETDAEEKAKDLRTDGKGLYEISAEQWLETFGTQGQTTYNDLQEGDFGHVLFFFFFYPLVSL